MVILIHSPLDNIATVDFSHFPRLNKGQSSQDSSHLWIFIMQRWWWQKLWFSLAATFCSKKESNKLSFADVDPFFKARDDPFFCYEFWLNFSSPTTEIKKRKDCVSNYKIKSILQNRGAFLLSFWTWQRFRKLSLEKRVAFCDVSKDRDWECEMSCYIIQETTEVY